MKKQRKASPSGEAFLIHRKLRPMNQNAPRGGAARGKEITALQSARARRVRQAGLFIPASNEPSAALARAFGECREGQYPAPLLAAGLLTRA